MYKKICVFSLVTLLSACSMTPRPDSVDARFAQAQKDVKQLYADQVAPAKRIDFYEALARGLKYNLDYRIKMTNSALQMGQLKMAEWAMFPSVNANGSIYSRSNHLASANLSDNGGLTGSSTSTPDTVRSARLGITWNVLDFGMSYLRAKQQANRYLIAQQEARRQSQLLAQDILTAYWQAYSAQQLINESSRFQSQLEQSQAKLAGAAKDSSVPRQNLLNYRAAVLEGQRQLIELQYRHDKAMFDLKQLVGMPLCAKLTLAPLPKSLMRTTNLHCLSFEKLDAITLVSRPELWGQGYQEKIAKEGVKIAILQALPGLSFSYGWNYNSNKYLENTRWADRSADLAWNLINLAALPDSYHSAKDLVKYEKLKRMALTLTALTETRYTYARYQSLRREYIVARQQTENANALAELASNKQQASVGSDQTAILARLHAITAKMNQDLVMANLSKARGQLYLSAGFDMLPLGISDQPLPVVTAEIRREFTEQNKMDFNHYVNFVYENLFASHQNAAEELADAAPQLVGCFGHACGFKHVAYKQ